MDDGDDLDPRVNWNREQTLRRALRSLQRRGLVELERCHFWPYADMPRGAMSPNIFWSYIDPDEYLPGEMRTMTGVLLTEGRMAGGGGSVGTTA